MSNFMNFSSDKAFVYLVLVDESGSMSSDARTVIKGLENFKKSFENFAEVGSIAVSMSKFSDRCELNPFCRIDEMNINGLRYVPDGATWLNYAVVRGAEFFKKYIDQIDKKKRISPIATFIVLSDGAPWWDRVSDSEAVKAINSLNDAGVTTIFVPCGQAASKEYGIDKGFMAIKDIGKGDEIVRFFGEELSYSVKEQSKRPTAMGSNFFSKAKGEQSAEYSQITAQVLEDEDWYDEI